MPLKPSFVSFENFRARAANCAGLRPPKYLAASIITSEETDKLDGLGPLIFEAVAELNFA